MVTRACVGRTWKRGLSVGVQRTGMGIKVPVSLIPRPPTCSGPTVHSITSLVHPCLRFLFLFDTRTRAVGLHDARYSKWIRERQFTQ